MRRIGAKRAAVIVAGLVLSLLAPVAPASAATRFHLPAADTIAAAVALSRVAFPAGADRALLGRADDFPDSLAAGVLQADAPLLLTLPDGLDARVAAEFVRLGVEEVVLLGGRAALAPAIESALRDSGYTVRRVAGGGRVETAVEVARLRPNAAAALLARSGAPQGEGARGFVDALAAGAWAADAGRPVLLSDSRALSPATAAYLEAAAIRTLTLVGGPAALGEAVAAQAAALGVAVTRVAGADRFATAAEVARVRGLEDAPDAVVLVDGERADAFGPGFAAAALAARVRAPLLLARSAGELPHPTRSVLRAADGAALWCAPLAAEQGCDEAGDVVEADAPTFGAWSPASTLDDAQRPSDDEDDVGRRELVLEAEGGPFTLALVDAATVSGGGDDALLTDSDGDGLVDGLGEVDARVELLRGMRINPAPVVAGVLPVDGELTIAVDATRANVAVRLVAFADLDADQQLSLDEDGSPLEPATVSGATVWVPPEGDEHAYADEQVMQAWPGLDLLTTAGASLRWGSVATFAYTSGQSSGVTLSRDDFEAMLSPGDMIGVSTSSASSRFTITRDVPAAPDEVRAVGADLDGDGIDDVVRVSWRRPVTLDLAPTTTYEVERATLGADGYAAWTVAAQVRGPGTVRTDVANVPDGTHRFRVRALNRVGDRSPASRHDTVVMGDEPPPAPVSASAKTVRGAAQAETNTVLDAGDRIEFTFDGPVRVDDDAWIDLRDTDGTLGRLRRGGNATMSTAGQNGELLTVAVSGPPELRSGSTGDGALSLAGVVAVAAADGIGNETGGWNLPASGRADAAGRTRVISAALSALPEPIPLAAVTANAATGKVTIAPAAAGVTTGDAVTLHDRDGAQLASGAYQAGAGLTLSASPPFSAGDRLYLVYTDASAGQLPSRTTTVLVASPAPAPLTVKGGGAAITVFFNEDITPLSGGVVEVWDGADLRRLARSTGVMRGDSDAVAVTLDTALTAGTSYRVHVGAGVARDSDSVSNAAATVAFTASAAPPTLALTAGPAHAARVTTAPVTWSGTSADSDGVVTSVQYRIDGGAWSTAGVSHDGPGVSVTWSATLTLAEGVRAVELRAVEHGGGVSAVAARTITVDIAAPLITRAAPVDGAPEILLTFSEPVTCPASGAAAWTFDEDDDGGGVAAASVDATGLAADQCRLTFAPPAFTAATSGRLSYGTPSGADRVIDAGGTVLAANSGILLSTP